MIATPRATVTTHSDGAGPSPAAVAGAMAERRRSRAAPTGSPVVPSFAGPAVTVRTAGSPVRRTGRRTCPPEGRVPSLDVPAEARSPARRTVRPGPCPEPRLPCPFRRC